MDNKKSSKPKVGSKKNPIPLSSKLSIRTLLEKHMPTIPDSDFARYKKNDRRGSSYVMNLITARGVNLDELRIALFLFDNYTDYKKIFGTEHVFSISDSPFQDNELGERSHCYFGAVSNPQKFKMPFPSLTNMLHKVNIIVENKDILKSLNTLHDLGIITLSEYRHKMLIDGSENEGVHFVHLSLNRGIESARLNLKWGKPVKNKEPVEETMQRRKLKSKALQGTLI